MPLLAVLHSLPTTPVDVVAGGFEIHAFRVIAPTPMLTATWNRELEKGMMALGGIERALGATTARVFENCTADVATEQLVSFHCRGSGSDTTGSAGALDYEVAGTLVVGTDGVPKDLARADVVTSTADLEALVGVGNGTMNAGTPFAETDAPCHATSDYTGVGVEGDGIDFTAVDEHDSHSCKLTWTQLAPILADLPVLRAIAKDGAPADLPHPERAWAKAPPRFTATGDTVHDALTGLEWASVDNGKDVTWQQASDWATAYRGGGHDDWRLPTETELELLAEPAAPHREPKDCTRGKSDLAVTSLIHLSCGLAWSSTTTDTRGVAMGFISGNPRAAKLTEKKNYRALVVRSH
ncbi:MAG TPA: DUF1566 domain-containing protein [Kofleriaceae bacterium]